MEEKPQYKTEEGESLHPVEDKTQQQGREGEDSRVLLVALQNLDEASYGMHSRDPLTRQIAATMLELLALLHGFSKDDFQPLPP